MPALALATADLTLSLRELNAAQAPEYYALIDRNRAHLTQFGNYEDEGRATLQWVEALLARPAAGLRFGVWLGPELVGQAELAHKLHTAFTVSYWLGREHVGRGLMSKAIFRLMQHARDRFGATVFFAGVSHGNARSAALLLGLGYGIAIDHAQHTVFRFTS